MRADILRQPLRGLPSVRSFIHELVTDEEITEIDIVVAWAKRSGLTLVMNDLRAFTERGGHLRIVTGISQGGATAQGLELVKDVANQAWVYHHATRTFHPKMYAGYGRDRAHIYVGSANLTAGGLSSNLELGLSLVADLQIESDAAIVETVRNWVEMLILDDSACKSLTDELFEHLTTHAEYGVKDEDATSTSDAGSGRGAGESVFTGSNLDFEQRPSRSTPRRRTIDTEGSLHGSLIAAQTQGAVVRRWYKKMSSSEASRKGGNTHPQGHLTLTQGPGITGHPRHPIRSATYFRNEFFADENWGPRSRGRGEEAAVSVRVVVGTDELGTYSLKVGHKSEYESGQGNRTSFLEWGPELNRYLRLEADHSGDIVTIEKMSNGGYVLTMANAATGAFLY